MAALPERSPSHFGPPRRLVASLLAGVLVVGVAVVATRPDRDEAELTVRSRGSDPTTSSTTDPTSSSSTSSTTAPEVPTTTAPPSTTTTAGPTTSTSGRVAVPRPVAVACPTANPTAEVRDGGVTIMGRDGDVRQLLRFRGIRSAVWAPDGRRVAVNWLDADGGRVATVDLDGQLSVVSSGEWPDRPLAWTPDGQVIYVTTEDQPGGPLSRIRIVSPSGGDATTVWQSRATTFGVVAVAGLADGRILFLSDEGLMVVNRDGSGVEPLAPVGLSAGEPGAPDLPRAAVRNFMLSPDRRRVATVAGGEVAMIDLATGAKLAATAGSGPTVLEWSADSRRVAFFGGIVLADDGTVRRLGGDDVAFTDGSDLAVTTWQERTTGGDMVGEVIGADGSRRLMAEHTTEVAGGPALAAIVDPPGGWQQGPRPGAVVCLAGAARALVVFPDADPHSLVWSADGSNLLVTTDFIDWLK